MCRAGCRSLGTSRRLLAAPDLVMQEPRTLIVTYWLHQRCCAGARVLPTGCVSSPPRCGAVGAFCSGCRVVSTPPFSLLHARRSIAPALSTRTALPFLSVLALELARVRARVGSLAPSSVLCHGVVLLLRSPGALRHSAQTWGGSVAVRPGHPMAGPAPLPITVITDDPE